jgi:membrane protease subunit HflC
MRRHWKVVLGVAVVLLAARSLYTVDETQLAVVTEFGRYVRTVDRPGLHAKLPWRTRRRFDRRLLLYNPRPSEFLTLDKKNLLVDNYVCWRIADPKLFLESVGDLPLAEMRLHDIVWSEVSAKIGGVSLSDLVNVDHDQVRSDTLMAEVGRRCDTRTRNDLGIEVVAVGIKRLNLPKENVQSVYERMRAERKRIAMQYRAEGEEQALKIRAEADKERERILAEAYREAETTKGRADAEATRIYAAAHQRDPDFYKMTRTLDSYQKLFSDKTTVVLSADSELLQLLTRGRPAR